MFTKNIMTEKKKIGINLQKSSDCQKLSLYFGFKIGILMGFCSVILYLEIPKIEFTLKASLTCHVTSATVLINENKGFGNIKIIVIK